MIVQHLELIYITKCLLLVSLYAASIPHTVPAKFTLSNFFDSTLSMIHPLVSAGSDRCESLKSFLGITYEQMQVKNKTNWYDVLNIDLVTKNGNIKYNLTATRRMNRLMARAQTIVILIHGFMESSNGWMVNALAPELLKKSVYKVFALDGRKIINLEYFSSSTNARFMGEMLGSFLSDVIKNGEDPSKIYIIGHSLGSHIAGIAGKKVYEVTGKRISRITALDPAGPCFSNITDSGRLARTDAEYVDVIHSNAGILGLKAPVTKTFTLTEGSYNLVAIYLYVITVELGSYLQNLLHHLNTFQHANVKTGQCLEKAAVRRTRYPTWVWNLIAAVPVYTSLLQKILRRSVWVPQAVGKIENGINILVNTMYVILQCFSYSIQNLSQSQE